MVPTTMASWVADLAVAVEVQIKIVAIAKAMIDETAVKAESWCPRGLQELVEVEIGKTWTQMWSLHYQNESKFCCIEW